MIDFNILSRRTEIFARLTGLKLSDFLKIIEQVRPLWCKLQKQKICSGRNSNIKSLENEVLMALIYYRCYISHFQLGMYFNLDASNVCRHLQKIEPILARVVAIKKDRTLSANDLDRMIVDATEVQMQRPKNTESNIFWKEKAAYTQI